VVAKKNSLMKSFQAQFVMKNNKTKIQNKTKQKFIIPMINSQGHAAINKEKKRSNIRIRNF